MKKIYLSAVLGIAFLLVMSSFVMAMPNKISGYEPGAKNSCRAGNSGVEHLYLVEKDADWNVVEEGAWGKMRIKDDFVFNGHGLEANTEYTLLRYDGETWPTVECLASGTSNKGGNINLAGNIGSYGNKVWLVLSDDVDCENSAMTGWNPSEYLFEYNLI